MEKSIPPKELARRLAKRLSSLAGDKPVAEFVESTDDSVLEGLSNKRIQKAQSVASKIQRGKIPSTDDMYHLEAIVHKYRPSHRIVRGKFDSFPDEFSYLSEHAGVRKRIEATFSSVGRIDITERRRYEGTGFVVGKNLVMTNRHVAQIFTEGVGRRRIRLQPWGSEIDFAEAPSAEEAEGYELIEPIMIHPYWDMALFRADLPDLPILKLSTVTYESLLRRNQDVVVVGYPAHDSRNGLQAQQDIFGNEYEVKRIAPGRVILREERISSRWLRSPVAALAHDASTLGGNSGSAVLNVDDGTVAALHFAGRYMLENYGVPGHELARDPRIIEAGVQFSGELPEENNDLEAYWDYVETTAPPTHTNSFNLGNQIMNQSNKEDITVEVPLQIKISLGRPVVGSLSNNGLGSPSSAPQGAGGDSSSNHNTDLGDEVDYEVGESTGSGYAPNFLSESVPTPRLSRIIDDDTFKLNGQPLIDYTHFSVCQSKSRRLPRFVAWNIDGGDLKRLSRRGIPFILDRRVPSEFQAGNELYRGNDYDRGHVARRADLIWGPIREAKNANRDSFFFTNMTPQHEEFNQSGLGGLWGELENAIFADAKVDKLKVSVFAGPIFRNSDRVYRDVQIPDDFWKLIAFHDEDDDEIKVAAYIISQKDLVFTEGQVDDEFHLYQVSLGKLAQETGLDFDDIVEFDSFDDGSESTRGGYREIESRNEVYLV